MHPGAERPGEALQGRAVSAHGGGGVARVRLRADGRPTRAGAPSWRRRPARARCRSRSCGSLLSVVRKPPRTRAQTGGLDDERRVRWRPVPAALHRGRGANLARRRDRGVEEVGGVRPGGVVPGDVEDAGPRCAPGRPGRRSIHPAWSPASTGRLAPRARRSTQRRRMTASMKGGATRHPSCSRLATRVRDTGADRAGSA